MMAPRASLNGCHIKIYLCDKVVERKHHRLVSEEAWAGTEAAFWAYVCPLTNTVTFKYLSRILTATDDV